MVGWKPVGFVLTVPPAVAALGLALLLVVLGLAWRTAPSVAARLGRPGSRAIRVVIVLIGAAGLVVAALIADVPSIGPGHSWGGDDPRLIAIVSAPSTGLIQFSNNAPVVLPTGEFVYAYASGVEIRHGISLQNTGPVPITILGIGGMSSPFVQGVSLRLPAGGANGDVGALYPGLGTDPWLSEPFVPFELQPGEETAAGLALRLVSCPGAEPVPTLSPGTDPADQDPYGSGFTAVTSLSVRWSALGIERETQIDLFAAIDVAVVGDLSSCAR